jgi:hypothetical protein
MVGNVDYVNNCCLNLDSALWLVYYLQILTFYALGLLHLI